MCNVLECSSTYMRRYEKRILPNYAYGYVFDKNKKQFALPDSVSETASIFYPDRLDKCHPAKRGRLCKIIGLLVLFVSDLYLPNCFHTIRYISPA